MRSRSSGGSHAVLIGAVAIGATLITGSVYSNTACGCVTPYTATKLVFTTQPASAVTGSPFVTQPVVKVEDAGGRVITTGSDSTIPVIATIQTGGGTLLGTVLKVAVAGVATFANLEIDTTGARTLRASGALAGPGAVTADSSSFTVTGLGPGTANVWVSTGGSDGTCARHASPVVDPGGSGDCLTFNKAYSIATPGDAVIVQCGTYANQTFLAANNKTSGPAVVFDGRNCVTAGGGNYIAGDGLGSQASWVTVKNMTLAGGLGIGDPATCATTTADHVSVINVTGNKIFLYGASNFLITGGSYGPMVNSDPASEQQNIWRGCGVSGTPLSGTFSGSTIHDITQTVSGPHINAIYLGGNVNGVTITGNHFNNIAQTDFRIDTDNGNVTNVTYTNNTLDAPCSHPNTGDACVAVTAIALSCHGTSTSITNVVIRNNSLDGPFEPSTPGGADCHYDPANDLFANNIVNADSTFGRGCADAGFYGGFGYSYDIFVSGPACGTGSVTGATIGFVNAGAYDFAITSASSGFNLVPAGQPFPATDITGIARPDSGEFVVDAGAYETNP